MKKVRFLVLGFLIGCTSALPLKSEPTVPLAQKSDADFTRVELPALDSHDLILKKTGFTIAINVKTKLARWAAYKLSADEVSESSKVVKRSNHFHKDGDLPEDSQVTPQAYARTGYDKGHMVPAEDMRRSPAAMEDCFSMANMEPQTPALNRGQWQRLERQVRTWAEQIGSIAIVTGPIFREATFPVIISVGIPVPAEFFKAVLDYRSGNEKAIAFILPQYPTGKFPSYVQTVRRAEAESQLNLFASLPESLQDRIETQADLSQWPQ